MTIAVYLRCSSANQGNASQAGALQTELTSRGLWSDELAEVFARAERDRYVLGETVGDVTVYSDLNTPGKVDKLARRKGWLSFVENMSTHSELIVFSADRVMRSMRDQLDVISALSVRGVKFTRLTATTTGDMLIDTLMETIDAWRSEREFNLLSQRIKAGIAKRRAEPGWVSSHAGPMFKGKDAYKLWADCIKGKSYEALANEHKCSRFTVLRTVQRVTDQLGIEGNLATVRATVKRNGFGRYWNRLMGEGSST